MPHVNQGPPEYDAIVVGSGVTGGWAAKELTEKGFEPLVLERGPNVRHGQDYPTEMERPWDAEYRGQEDRASMKTEQYIQSQAGLEGDSLQKSYSPLLPF